MAKAKIKKKVVLELSEYEARTLCEVFQHIGGPPEGPKCPLCENEKEQDRICLRSFL